MTNHKKPLSARTEVSAILRGIRDEILCILSGGIIKPSSRKKASKRIIGATFRDEAGRTLKVIAKDATTKGGYIIQRSDGRFFTLYRRTIEEYLNDL